MKAPVLFLSLLVALTGSLSAGTLAETPVQSAFEARVNSVADHYDSEALKQLDDFGNATPSADDAPGKKSLFKAVLLSALVPGGGHYYLGQKRTARFFFAGEALTWIGFASFKLYGDWKEDDYIEFAAAKANAQLEGRDDEFVDLVGFYTDTREYNTLGRIFEQDRPFFPDTPENHWQWKNAEDRRQFRDLKNQSRESDRRADFMLGVAIVGRVVSIIDAARNVSRVNRRIGNSASLSGQDWQLTVDPLDTKQQVKFSFYPGL